MSLTVNHLIEIVLTPLNAIGLTPFHADFLIPVQEMPIPPICDPPHLRS